MTTREEVAETITGYQIGSGYYALDIGSSEALEIADLVMPLLAKAWEEGREAMCGQDNGGPMAVNPYTAEAQVDGL